jgi:hypothetical protein
VGHVRDDVIFAFFNGVWGTPIELTDRDDIDAGIFRRSRNKEAIPMETAESRKQEWLRLMTELADTDRDAYREARADAWGRVARGHKEKTPEQIKTWCAKAS